MEEFLARLELIVTGGANLLVTSWAIRKFYDLDEPRDRRAGVIRWTIVATGVIICAMPIPYRVGIGGPTGLVTAAFLLWPNCSVHLSRWSHRRALRSCRDAEIGDIALDLVRRMREFERSNEPWRLGSLSPDVSVTSPNDSDTDQPRDMGSKHQRQAFQKLFLFRIRLIKEELLRRLRREDRTDETLLSHPVAFDGFLAGPSPISDAANYLERLARRLSH